MLPRKVLTLLLLTSLATGCGSLRPLARQGHDLLENPSRSAAIRAPAGLGAIIGNFFALPVAIILYPSWLFEDAVVESCDAPVAVAQGTSSSSRVDGDIYVSLVQAPFEYGSGLGAAFFGQPFEWVASAFRAKPPAPPPGQVVEIKEPHPSAWDPGAGFQVTPPRQGAKRE